MTRSELILRLTELNPHLYQKDAEQVVATIFDEITEALADGDRVELRGFGAFSVKKRDARDGGRDMAPMTVAKDAFVLETTHLNRSEVLAEAVNLLRAQMLDQTS